MKKSNKNLYILVVFTALLFSCNGNDKQNTKTAVVPQKQEEHSEAPGIKEVELNEAQFNAAGITLGTFSMRNLSNVVSASGYTKLPPQNQAEVSVHLGGIVTSINVIEGQSVKKGQVLAILQSPEFAKLQEAYISSKSNLEYLNKEFERQRVLSAENVTSKKVFERTKSDLDIEQARFTSLDKQLSLLNLSKKSVTSAMALTAPIAGHISHVNITIGAHAQEGQPLVGIVDNTKLHVDLMVYEKDLSKVKEGQTITLALTNQNGVELKGKVFNVSRSFEGDAKAVAVHADINNANESLIAGMYVTALIDVGSREVEALPTEAIVKADGREFIFVLEEHGDDEHEHNEAEEKNHDEDNYDNDEGQHHEEESDMHHFQRIEVKTGTSQLGYVQITLLHAIDKEAQIVLNGAYYLQSHLIKSEGGGGHHHH
ncbi:efflux RND transporter periplasmic adaptor subunit [Flavobacterium rhizosphaerae]|uniref:Efflux RND transporter periplasmic adaptor subunit n=1 Tax=Flavobacterium rhizosphaerae TaxID=3163298 RepID=A0ABW8YUX4_9FLAO